MTSENDSHEHRERESVHDVGETAKRASPWNADERRRIAEFFVILDRWDRQLNSKERRQAS